MATLKLTKKESEEIFFTSLCNALSWLDGYGLELSYDRLTYRATSEQLREKNASSCHEDVLMQMLHDGHELTLIDHEGDGEYTRSISLKDVHNRVSKTPVEKLMNILNEVDDVIDADCVLQTVWYEEIIFG